MNHLVCYDRHLKNAFDELTGALHVVLFQVWVMSPNVPLALEDITAPPQEWSIQRSSVQKVSSVSSMQIYQPLIKVRSALHQTI